MTRTVEGLSSVEYLRWCATLGRPVVDVVTLNPADRAAALPTWCAPELIATPAARDRLRVWVDSGSPVPSADDIVRRTRYVGDEEVRGVVLLALEERIAAPAAWYLLHTVVWAGVGWAAAGWAVRCAMPPDPVLNLVLLSGSSRDEAAVLDVVLHEAAHIWLQPRPPAPLPLESMSNERGAALIVAAKRPDFMDELLKADARDEHQADALSRAWGGRLSCTAERDNAYTLREAARLHERYGQET